MRRIILLTAAALLISACMESPTQPAEAAPFFGIASGQSLPFAARHVSQIGDASAVECEPGQGAGRSLIVKGNATYLGKYTGDAWACFAPIGPLSLQSFSAGVSLTAANGDEVWLEMDPDDPQLWEIAFSDAGVVVTSAGGFFIVGGTGRFEGAAGRVRITSSRVGAEATTSTLVGTIS